MIDVGGDGPHAAGLMKRVALFFAVVSSGCTQSNAAETWEPVMGQVDFTIEQLHFEPNGAMHAVERLTGRTLDRNATWNGWTPSPAFVENERPLQPALFRLWDINGNVFVSGTVIYRSKRGEARWSLVPGSVGRQLITVDPSGNVFAANPSVSVLPAGGSTWVPTAAITRIDAKGRAFAGNVWLDGTNTVADDQLSPQARFDANGDVLDAIDDGTTVTVTRREFAKSAKTELAKFTKLDALEFVGCGLEGTCLFLKDRTEVMLARGSTALRQVGSMSVTSKGESLNFAGVGFTVGPDGLFYLWDTSGQTTTFSRVYRLRPGTAPWPGEGS